MVAFMLAHEQFPAPELIRLGAAAENAGFDLVATSDHFQPWQANERHAGQAWVTLGALGQRTQRVWMGPTVTCPTLRYNPAVVAEAFATLSLLYPGRIFLGLGSGEALNEQAATGEWPVWRERWDRLIEAVTIIRQLWTGQPLQHKGAHYTVDGKLYDPPAQPIPLLLAANGPKAMKLAGEHGDGLITDPQTWKQHKGEWEKGARSAGKDPGAMPVLVEAFVVVGDQSEARAAAKLWNFIPKAFKGYQNIPDPAQIEQPRPNGTAITEGLWRLDRQFQPGRARANDQEALRQRRHHRQHPFGSAGPAEGHRVLRQGSATASQEPSGQPPHSGHPPRSLVWTKAREFGLAWRDGAIHR